MKAKQFKDLAPEVASFLAVRAGITPGYWRQLLVKDLNIPADKREALAAAVDAYGRHLLFIAETLHNNKP